MSRRDTDPRLSAEIREELDYHLERCAYDLVSEGWEPAAAAAEAQRRFGDPAAVDAECRRARFEERRAGRWRRWSEEALADLRQGLRQLHAEPGFAAIAVLTLALGIGATTAGFSALYAVALRPLPFPEPRRVVLVGERGRDTGELANVSVGNFVFWRTHSQDVFEQLAALDYESYNLDDGAGPERALGARVSSGYFELFGVAALHGRWLHHDENAPGRARVVVLAHGLWSRRFGADPGVLGRELRLNGVPHTVVGVMPASFSYLRNAEQLWTPIAFTPEQQAEHDGHFLDVYGRLREGVELSEARQRMRAVAAALAEVHPYDAGGVILAGYADWLLGDHGRSLLLMSAAMALVLLIACANVAQLLLARGVARAREIAVRTALGASRARLARQLLTEALVLALLGGAGGGLLAIWLTAVLAAGAPLDAPRLDQAGVGVVSWAFALALALLSCLAAGLLPALVAVRGGLASLRNQARTAEGRGADARLRTLLVASELALALALLAGAGLLLRSVNGLQRVPPGFRPEAVISAGLTLPRDGYAEAERSVAAFEQIAERIGAAPGVARAAFSSQVPMGPGGGSNGLIPEGRSRDELVVARLRIVTPEYFATLGIELEQGRGFDGRERRDTPLVMVVSRALARAAWPGESPLGKRVLCCESGDDDPRWKSVIGVAGDVRSRGLDAPPAPEFYLPAAQVPPQAWDWIQRSMTAAVRVAPGASPERALAALREAVSAVDPTVPLHDVASMQERVDRSLARPRYAMSLLVAVGLTGGLLAVVGVYGVVSYLVTRRRHEIGVRLALGARRGDVARLVLGQALLPVAAGVAGGLALCLAGGRLLESQLYSVSARDPLTLGAVAALLALVALAACLLPARRAARLDPTQALRGD